MAFLLDAFNNVSSGAAGAFKVWSYKQLDDNLATIIASDYFNTIRFRLHKDDIIFAVGSDGSDQLIVTSSSGTTVTVEVYIPSAGGAPADGTYITQTANAELDNEQVLADLGTGILQNATGTGVLSINSNMTDISNLGTAADKYLYTTALNTWAEGAIVSAGRDMLSTGMVGYDNLDIGLLPTAYQFAIGCAEHGFQAPVTSDGATVLLTFEGIGGGDVPVVFDGGLVTVDCTPALTIALTVGTDEVPVDNFVYILKSAPTVLTKSTVGFPSAVEYMAVGEYLVPSASTAQTYGIYSGHQWSDELWQDNTHNGHLTEVNYWIRHQPCTWLTGLAMTPTLTSASPDTLTFAITTGTALQLHQQPTPAFDTSDAGPSNLDTFFVVNNNSAAYTVGKDLYDSLLDSAGNSATNNDRVSWVIWAVVSQNSEDFKIMVNLPSGFYANDNDAIADPSNYTNYSIGSEYKGNAILLYKTTYKYQTSGGGTLTLVETVDLRGSFPSSVAGGSGGSGASIHLDNLASVAVNTSLISDTDVTDDLGSLAIRWKDIYASGLSSGDTAADTLTISGYDVDGAASVDFLTVTSNNTPTAVLSGDVTSTTQSASDNSTKLATTAYVDAAAGGGGTWVKIASATAATSATIDFDNVFDSTYETYIVTATSVTPSTDGSRIYAQVGTTATPTYQATSYVNGSFMRQSNSGITAMNLTTAVALCWNASNVAAEGLNTLLNIQTPASTSHHTTITGIGTFMYQPFAGVVSAVQTGGMWTSTTAVTSLRFLASAGNIETGEFTLWGVSTA